MSSLDMYQSHSQGIGLCVFTKHVSVRGQGCVSSLDMYQSGDKIVCLPFTRRVSVTHSGDRVESSLH